MEGIRASIAMAVYNGEKYLPEQIESIIQMLGDHDELIISDDGSTDQTISIIRSYQKKHQNIVLVENHLSKGVCGNFTNAVKHCKGEYIFLSDQDDVWIDQKIDVIVDIFIKTNADMVIHDGRIANGDLSLRQGTLLSSAKITTNPFLNWYKGRFFGCCIAFTRQACDYLIPFPDDVPHDIYSSILAGIFGKIITVPECYIIHRLHDDNVTPEKRRKLIVILWDRIILAYRVITRLIRYKFSTTSGRKTKV